MNRHFLSMFIIILLMTIPFSSAFSNTDGLVEFSFATKPTDGKYSPEHVLAVWVTDTSGNFIKTLKIQGQKMKFFLSSWLTDSELNEVDAVTTATLKKHQTHTVTWDCSDTTGTVVPDGIYRIHVEFTEENGQGPVIPPNYVEFEKGDESVSITPKDLTHFYNLKFVYKPEDQLE